MKKLLLLISILSILSSCHQKTKEENAKALIDDQLKNSLDDYKSYESVKFSTLDSAYTNVLDDSTYIVNQAIFDDANKDSKDDMENVKVYLGLNDEKYNVYMKSLRKDIAIMQISKDKMDSIMDHFKPVFAGWKMNHSYRAKTTKGNLEIFFYDYYFDSSVTKLIRHTDVTDNTYHKTVIDSLQNN